MKEVESHNEIWFTKEDRDKIDSIKKKEKKLLYLYLAGALFLSLTYPFIPSRIDYVAPIEDLTYLQAFLSFSCFILLVFGIPILIGFRRKYKDYTNGKKIVLTTTIQKIKKDKRDLKLKLSSPNFVGWLFLYRDKIYNGISVNDRIKIEYLPLSKNILELKKLNGSS
jgi:hypothetical protein